MSFLKRRLNIYLALFISSVSFGVLGFVFIEKFSIIDAFYFTIVTMSTVGYGDLYPITPSGKLLSVFLIIIGVATFLGVISTAIDLMLNNKDHQQRQKKLNIVVGLFFSEIGNLLLKMYKSSNVNLDLANKLNSIQADWKDNNYTQLHTFLKNSDCLIDVNALKFDELLQVLSTKKDFLISVLEHPALLENEAFTELLRAIFHLYEEFTYRLNTKNLNNDDLEHLSLDMKRVFIHLSIQWLSYLKHLQKHHNYLFLYAISTNPFKSDLSGMTSS